MYWRDGQPVERISVSDRSFQYGDGCFTTILTKDGKLQLWAQHVKRMEHALRQLAIDPVDWNALRDDIENRALPDPQAGIKLHVSRGEGGRGYSAQVHRGPFVTISCFEYPQNYDELRENGIEMTISEVKLGHSPILAGLKHNNRLEQILAKSDVENAGYLDGIVLDFKGNVIETTMANLFWVKGKQVFTPELSLAGVSGVMREQVLELLNALGQSVTVDHFTAETLLDADEVFVTNCILGVAPVTKIREVEFSKGSLTKQIQEKLSLC
ncbi:aminodeoxychorismate lyase [Vibrio sp. 10N]|uniref:aminodeoxychorismate lyase n=1 Tax=Vibrio sp. 10N TaxID=3058938 RepID=UPI0028136869|nr:aminodeoxychorismate lyase [Vibrio sp. 10N]